MLSRLSRLYQRTIPFAFTLALASPVLAQITDVTPSSVAGGQFSDLGASIQTIFNFTILIVGIIFVILFLVGGVQYLTAAGNEEQTGKAKRLLVDAVVGLVIVLAAWAVGNFILGRLGVGVTTGNQGAGGGAVVI